MIHLCMVALGAARGPGGIGPAALKRRARFGYAVPATTRAAPRGGIGWPVSTNGCGPAGFGLMVPDGPFGAACNTHDTCYSQFGASQASCDSAFASNMITTCNENYGCFYDHESGQVLCGDHGQLMGCLSYRQTILDGIGSGFGAAIMSGRFETLRNEANCRAWYNARAVESTCTP